MYVCFGLCLLITTKLVYLSYIISKNNRLDPKNSLQNVIIKELSIQVFLFKSILQIPIAESFLGIILCSNESAINKQSNCYAEANYLVHVGFATTGYLLNLAINVLLIMLLEDNNFDSNYPLASNKCNYMKFKFIIR